MSFSTPGRPPPRQPTHPGEILLGKRLEDENPHPGEERRNHLEGGILRRSADQGDQTALHMGEKGVLLGLVEAMDLIHEEDRPAPVKSPQFGGFVDDAPNLLNP